MIAKAALHDIYHNNKTTIKNVSYPRKAFHVKRNIHIGAVMEVYVCVYKKCSHYQKMVGYAVQILLPV